MQRLGFLAASGKDRGSRGRTQAGAGAGAVLWKPWIPFLTVHGKFSHPGPVSDADGSFPYILTVTHSVILSASSAASLLPQQDCLGQEHIFTTKGQLSSVLSHGPGFYVHPNPTECPKSTRFRALSGARDAAYLGGFLGGMLMLLAPRSPAEQGQVLEVSLGQVLEAH